MDCSANQEENFGTGKFNTETAKESRNNTDRTGWEDEREYKLSAEKQMNNLLEKLKKKWIPIFFGIMIGVQVIFQTVSILLEIYLN